MFVCNAIWAIIICILPYTDLNNNIKKVKHIKTTLNDVQMTYISKPEDDIIIFNNLVTKTFDFKSLQLLLYFSFHYYFLLQKQSENSFSLLLYSWFLFLFRSCNVKREHGLPYSMSWIIPLGLE